LFKIPQIITVKNKTRDKLSVTIMCPVTEKVKNDKLKILANNIKTKSETTIGNIRTNLQPGNWLRIICIKKVYKDTHESRNKESEKFINFIDSKTIIITTNITDKPTSATIKLSRPNSE